MFLRKMLAPTLVALIALGASANAAERIIYLVPDASGSPVAAMDEQGEVIWRKSYKPYGEETNPLASNPNPSYTGKPLDADTGLVYMGARMYDPETARFTGIDPQGFYEQNPQSFGRYIYANNSPYVYNDPDGEASLSNAAKFLPAAGGAALADGPLPAGELVGLSILFYGLLSEPAKSPENEAAAPPAATDDNEDGEEQGCIYCVSGEKTQSGKDYVGSTDDLSKRQKDKTDGRDREGAQVIDRYKKGDRETRQQKEQQAMNDRGGVKNLDNKRNEIAPNKWGSRGVTPPNN